MFKFSKFNGMMRGGIILEFFKVFMFLVLFINAEFTLYVLFWVLVVITLIAFKKSYPTVKKIIDLCLNEEDLSKRDIYCRARSYLFGIFIFDLLFFIPCIQGVLRYKYWQLEEYMRNNQGI